MVLNWSAIDLLTAVFPYWLHMVADKSSDGNSEALGHLVWCCVVLLRLLLFVICDVVQQGEVVNVLLTCSEPLVNLYWPFYNESSVCHNNIMYVYCAFILNLVSVYF